MVSNPSWPSWCECLDALREGEGEGVRVAVLDTGVDTTHPDLAALDIAGSWQPDGNNWTACQPHDPGGHGTGIAGIIHRLAPRAQILSVMVLGPDQRQHQHEILASGAMLAIREGATILNCSLGTPESDYRFAFYRRWTDAAFRAGRLVVAAASNLDVSAPELPAFLPQVVGVSSEDLPEGRLAWCEGHPVPVRAPGHLIRLALPGGGYDVRSGSSFAAAYVSGLLARLKGAFPGLPAPAAHGLLQEVARKGGLL